MNTKWKFSLNPTKTSFSITKNFGKYKNDGSASARKFTVMLIHNTRLPLSWDLTYIILFTPSKRSFTHLRLSVSNHTLFCVARIKILFNFEGEILMFLSQR